MKTAAVAPEGTMRVHNAPSPSTTWFHNVRVPLSDQVDVAGFHTEATRLLAQQVPPETVEWSAAPAQSVGEEALDVGRAAIHNRAARAIIPQSFIRMSELVVLHRDPQRFDLLYRSLWRLVYEPDLKKDYGDADLARLRQMAQAVRRDIQKMKAKLVFHPMTLNGESVPVARYEPSHYVCETVGTWLANREPSRRWLLLTPDRSLLWNGTRLLSAPAVAPMHGSHTACSEAEWAAVLEKLPWA
jgi:DNA polymerase